MKPRIPCATYRLQFNRGFTFQQANELADYLLNLGVSDLYASPLFQAGPESTHGYDTCAFDRFNSQLGGREAFDRLTRRLQELGLGLLLDMVPNHMGNDLSNCHWLEVLERGQDSASAQWFDVDWNASTPGLEGKVLLPVLEDHYDKVLEAGKLRLDCDQGKLSVAYYERKFPLAFHSYRGVLTEVLENCHRASGAADASERLRALLEEMEESEPPSRMRRTAEGELVAEGSHFQARQRQALERSERFAPPSVAAPESERAAESMPRSRRLRQEPELGHVQEQLAQCLEASPGARSAMAATLQSLNGRPGQPRSFDKLDEILRQQHYRLACWRVGPAEINYRRFFDITSLVALRMEVPEVFEATHEFVLSLLKENKVTGLRIDHPDGLWNPKEYLTRLQTAGGPLYIVMEKILTGNEPLPADWPAAGTTGYDFLNRVNGLFIQQSQSEALETAYRELTGCPTSLKPLVHRFKRQVLEHSFQSEWSSLAGRLKSLAATTRYGQDFTQEHIRRALATLLAAFPIYRTYQTEDTTEVPQEQAQYVRAAIEDAKASPQRGAVEDSLFDFIQALLLLQFPPDWDESSRAEARRWIMQWQQLTGPLMAKGLEDTTFYNFNRLISLNEVGGDPGAFGVSVEQFHAHNLNRAAQWPHSLLGTATHDTKRGEDARARIDVISELPEEWQAAVRRWQATNILRKQTVDGQSAPHPNDEYLLYQTLIGAWPADADTQPGLDHFRERIQAYMLKAARESKVHTSWTTPNAPYEEALRHFVHELLSKTHPNPFLTDFTAFQRRIAFFGQFNSLSQVLLKMTCPGVPDFYQGTELWDFNLVDPDNRRPVDYELRRRLLQKLQQQDHLNAAEHREYLSRLLQRDPLGESKLYAIWRALAFRRQHQSLFQDGAYYPLPSRGPRAKHLCAFLRQFDQEQILVAIPRLLVGLTGGAERVPTGTDLWQGTELELPAAATYRNLFTAETISSSGAMLLAAEALSSFPVALFERVA